MATAYAERKVLLKQRQAELNAQARFLAGESSPWRPAHAGSCQPFGAAIMGGVTPPEYVCHQLQRWRLPDIKVDSG